MNKKFKGLHAYRYINIPDEWTLPEPQEYKDQGNLHSYLLDPDAYDQYYVMSGGGSLVQIWQNSAPEPVVVEDRPVRFLIFATFIKIYYDDKTIWLIICDLFIGLIFAENVEWRFYLIK